ncbi:MAG: DinB family protein [Sphingobacteriaceae bacterium]|nr:DinB family protein [Cytophagaceae bacterium]
MTLFQQRNLDLIDQLSDLLSTLPTAAYTQPQPLLHGSSVGQHVRHITEFYQCLLGQTIQGTINYDARRRNLCLETDLMAARRALHEAAFVLMGNLPDAALMLEDGEGARVQTSLFRELTYLIEHSVHHMAMLKVALKAALPDFSLPDTFGVAHSTQRHRAQLAVAIGSGQ